ncbi:hypothetical protein [Brevibacterium spongiae]|uniref:Isochorismatase family protein n=1 Tax=Brevibacterium spongiae TaxID=2909672 RepID=A0ABY5SMT8_9MICO|nr:hypothetical protein [Brevibacterium spongiae]UVI35882.1 hypothetical protein L1F31_17480 [Brevibacterium spongiae]
MDALLLIDTDDASYPSDDAMETLGDIVTRTRAVGGVLIFASTKEDLAETPDEELSIFVPDEEDLVLRSNGPDVFEGVDDLAAGLHDLAVDRIIIAGADATDVSPANADTDPAPTDTGSAADAGAGDAGSTADAADTAAAGEPSDSAERLNSVGTRGAVYASAMAGLVCNFDVIVLSDSTTDPAGELVTWTDAAESAGAMVKKTADTWLRM